MPDDLGLGVPDFFGRLPPGLVTPPVPSDALRPLLGQPNPDQLVEACAAGAFAAANPSRDECLARRWAAELRKRAAENEATQIASRLQRTSDEKSIPAGVEPGLVESRLQRWGKIVLLLAAFTTIASSLNVAAAYVLESGAWSSLVEYPLLAFLFVIVAPAGGVGGIIGVANELRDDEAKRRFRMGLGVATLITWFAWLAGLAALYALQSLIGDSGGRRLPDGLADADGLVHGWILISQLLAEVLAGALFKLMSAQAENRGIKWIIVPDSLREYLERRFDMACDAASDAAAGCGRIDDFERNYRERLGGFVVACRAEFARLKLASEAAQATARADFLRPPSPKSL